MGSTEMLIKRSFPILIPSGSHRILGIQPHADDLDISLGASIAQLSAEGAQITYLTVTDELGTGAQLPPGVHSVRRDEQQEAASLLGVTDLRWLGYGDAGAWTEDQLMRDLVGMIELIRPDIILAPDPHLLYEAHPDHLKTGRAAAAAAMLYRHLPSGSMTAKAPETPDEHPLKAVGFYYTPRPNVFMRCGVFRSRKRAALERHRSQFSEQTLEELWRYDGLHNRTHRMRDLFSYREGLKILPPILLHCIPEAADY
ncbi:MAG: PIG-L family deacetylase [Spirochaetia bacterium]|nr:PIG-L family deacetylase [Spirochaetia bacterium]MCF7941882.1 PIG-L family deacetylase [Spirochaetia bacterium]